MKCFLLEVALGVLVLQAPISCAEDPQEMPIGLLSAPPEKGGKTLDTFDQKEEIHNTSSLNDETPGKTSYTINFNNVSIIEYIRFVSKIANLNFVFNEADLQFSVTILSEDPVTPRNIMSILVQILRIHNLLVLEQENNLIITNAKNVNQIATIVSSDLPEGFKGSTPVVTRVFRIKNANLSTVASIIRPMLSDSSLLEISAETKQLIVTDVTTNVDKISTLLATIDIPHTSLEIDSFEVQNSDPAGLIALATQILTPFAEGNPLIFVPHAGTRTIFIVSTPYLVERALAVLEDLDIPPLQSIQETQQATLQKVFLYKLQHQHIEAMMGSLNQMADELQARGGSSNLVEALKQAKPIKEADSILFISNEETIAKIKEIVPTLDTITPETPRLGTSDFYIYKIQAVPHGQLESSIEQMTENLEKAPRPDQALITALNSRKYIKETNSFIFTGTPVALQRVQSLLASMDVAHPVREKGGEVFLYKPKYVSKAQLQEALTQLAKTLSAENSSDVRLSETIGSVNWVSDTQTFIFHGDPATIARLKDLLSALDAPEGLNGEGARTFYVYKLQNATGDTVISNLQKVAKNLEESGLPNQPLIDTIKTAKWMKDNNSLVLTGSSSAIDQAKNLVEQFDVAGQPPPPSLSANKSSFYIYQPVNQSPQTVQAALEDIGQDLETSGLIDPDLLLTLQTVRYVESSNSLVFTGSPESITKVKELIAHVDVVSPEEVHIQQLGHLTFLIYKIQYVPGAQLTSALRGLATDLQRTGAIDQNVVNAINSMKWIKETNSILFTGSAATLQQVELMVKKFDIPALAPQPQPQISMPVSSNFVVYTPKNQPGEELIKILEEFEQNLISAGVSDKNLFDSINNLKWVPRTCSLIISGDNDAITKVEDLLRRFDIPSREPSPIPPSIESIENTSFLIYKLQYHQGSEILSALKEITVEIIKSNASANQNLVNAINSLQWVKVTNSLLASGEQETLSKLRDLVQNLDVPLKQIFIEILVIETSLTNTQNFGLQWGGKFQYLNRFSAGTGNFPLSNPNSSATSPSVNIGGTTTNPGISQVNGTTTPSTTMIPFTTGWDLGVIGDIIMHKGKSFLSLGSLVNALQADTDSTVLLNPKIITQDNRTSTIFVGNNIPFIGSLVTSSQTGFFNQSSNIEYRDIGFNLTITPTVGTNDVVTMDISNDISEVTNTPNIGTTQNSTVTGIQTSHTTMTTRVHVPSKHFVVLSGMIQDSKARFRSSVPCLGGLPVIGAAFSENDRLVSKQNVIFFVCPHVINTIEEYKEITEKQEHTFKEDASLPVLKEEFDAGVDLVKTPENE